MNIESIRRRLLIKYPLFGSVIANYPFVENSLIPTAETDGVKIYYNPTFVESLTKSQQVFLFAHEIFHIAYNHIDRSEGKDLEIWNIACDAVDNAQLKKDGLPLIEGGIDIPEAVDYDVEEMYQKLYQEKKEKEQKQNSFEQEKSKPENGDSAMNEAQSGQNETKENANTQENHQKNSQSNEMNEDRSGEQKENNCFSHHSHSMWKEAVAEKKRQKDSNLDDTHSSKQEEQSKNSKIEELQKLGEKEFFNQNRMERKKQLEKLKNELVRNSHSYGTDTNGEIRVVEDIGISQPLIDWRRLLKEAIKYDVDWSYQNAEIENGVLMAHLEELPFPETEIILDTSGSIEVTLLRNFLRECKNIFQTSKVKVGCFDTKFYGFTELKNLSDIDHLSFYGGGGTDFDVAVNAFTKRVENKIIFTDGNARMPEQRMDVIWIVFGNEKINPPGGRVIYIDPNQLDSLDFKNNKGGITK